MPAALLRRGRLKEAVFFTVLGGAPLAGFVMAPGTAPGFPMAAGMLPMALAAATLTALGAHSVLAPGGGPDSPSAWLPALGVVAAGAAVVLFAPPMGRGAALIVLGILAPFMVLRFRWLGTVCGAALLFLLFADLSLSNVNLYQHPFQDPAFSPAWHTLAKEIRERSLGERMLTTAHPLDTALPANLGMLAGLPDGGGALIPLDRDQAAWWRVLWGENHTPLAEGYWDLGEPLGARRLLNYMGVRVIVSAPQGAFDPGPWIKAGLRMRESGRVGTAGLFVNESALPRAYWRPFWRGVPTTEEALSVLAQEDFNGKQAVVLTLGESSGPSNVPSMPDGGAFPPVDWEGVGCRMVEDAPERVVLELEAPQDGIAVLADCYNRGWRAELDGESAPVYRANGLFRGVAVPAGKHTLVFRYRPWEVHAGWAVSALGALFLALGALRGAWRSMRGKMTPPAPMG